jgi:hypothetical protein
MDVDIYLNPIKKKITLCNAIFKWGKKFMCMHPICKFEELEAAFCKCYQKIQIDEQVYMAL